MAIIYNLDFWSAIFGMVGTLLIFIFGLPPKIDIDGHMHLIAEQVDEGEKKKAKKYKLLGYLGLLLLFVAYLLQLVKNLTVP